MYKKETFHKKVFCNNNIEKLETLHVLHGKVTLLMTKHSERATRNCHQKSFRKVWTRYIENIDQKMNVLYESDEIEIRLFFTDLTQHFGIYLVVFALKFSIH